MHQHGHPHAFTPILHRSSTILPAPGVMETQDRNFNMQLSTQTLRTSFAPVSAFQRAKQKFVRPQSQGRWGALHVCIAWKIHYHKQLKQMQQKPNSLHQEHPVQHKESQQLSCMHPYLDFRTSCGPYSYGNMCDRGETGKIKPNRSHPSDLRISSPASCHSCATKREKREWEKLEQPSNLHWKEIPDEEEKHRSCQTDTTKDLPLGEKSQDPKVTPELDSRHSGSVGRKRQLECESFIKVKRAKQEILDNQFGHSKTLRSDQSPLITTHTHPASHTVQVQHMTISDLSILYPNSRRCNVSYPVTELNSYKAASLEPMWDIHKRMDLHFRQNVLKDYSLNSCKVVRIPVAAQGQQEPFHGFFAPPLHFPPTLRQQETVYLRGRETLMPRNGSSPLQISTPSSWHSGNILPGTVNLKGLSDKKGEQKFP